MVRVPEDLLQQALYSLDASLNQDSLCRQEFLEPLKAYLEMTPTAEATLVEKMVDILRGYSARNTISYRVLKALRDLFLVPGELATATQYIRNIKCIGCGATLKKGDMVVFGDPTEATLPLYCNTCEPIHQLRCEHGDHHIMLTGVQSRSLLHPACAECQAVAEGISSRSVVNRANLDIRVNPHFNPRQRMTEESYTDTNGDLRVRSVPTGPQGLPEVVESTRIRVDCPSRFSSVAERNRFQSQFHNLGWNVLRDLYNAYETNYPDTEPAYIVQDVVLQRLNEVASREINGWNPYHHSGTMPPPWYGHPRRTFPPLPNDIPTQPVSANEDDERVALGNDDFDDSYDDSEEHEGDE